MVASEGETKNRGRTNEQRSKEAKKQRNKGTGKFGTEEPTRDAVQRVAEDGFGGWVDGKVEYRKQV
jgi:hypothetical protein